MIFLYRFLTFLLFPIFLLIIYLRRFTNKEDKIRFKEKISINKIDFPKNKRVFWIHAASIGEMNSVFPLVSKLTNDNENIFILLTSTTLSSSELIKKKKFNKNNIQHHFFPIDVQFLVKKFINYWKPELVIFVDSEVWPNYLIEISQRKIPLILLNGRITMKTYRRWKLVSRLSLKLFGLYDLCLSSSKESEKNLKSLGAKTVKFIGNLKFATKINSEKRYINLKSIFDKHNIWCAASTHPGEEEIILKTHTLLKQKGIKIITIIIPRHIYRSKDINKISDDLNIKSQIVSKFEDISKDSEILIINSIGEMIDYFHNCKSIFMGKSLSKKLIKVGGQNPIEPAKCGCKIYHGPYISNFKEIYSFLKEKKFTHEVINEIDLSQNLIKDFNNKDTDKRNIDEINFHGDRILNSTINEIFQLSK